MPKPFYEFDGPSFRDDLFAYYIVPVARWFMRDPTSEYFLPQASGSNWECSLAIEFFLHLVREPAYPEEMRAETKRRILQTGRWLLTQVREEGSDAASWDGASWDTAVCLGSIIAIADQFGDELCEKERASTHAVVGRLVNWLVALSAGWEQNTRYGAGPADLAKVLQVLVTVAHSSPAVLREAEKRVGMNPSACILDEIARVLIAMSEERPPGNLGSESASHAVYWGDAFNSSEVIEALASYIHYREKGLCWGSTTYEAECRALVYRGVTFIETTQEDGMWGGVADTPGTLLGYLRVVEHLPEIDHVAHVVFKALRWMCEDDKAVDDGSFLHTSYVTVFYSLALWEAYESWGLGSLPTSEVYDISLWRLASPVLLERSRRLELELRMEDLKADLCRRTARSTVRAATVAALIAGILSTVVGIGVLAASGAVRLSGDLRLSAPDSGLFWGVVAVWLPVASSLIGTAYAYAKSRSH